jgi:hypothetical protein
VSPDVVMDGIDDSVVAIDLALFKLDVLADYRDTQF